MMTPEQQQAFRTRIQSDCVSGVALDRIVAAVDDMLATERAAERERCAKVCEQAKIPVVIWYPKNYSIDPNSLTDIYREQVTKCAAAIRVQGDGNG